LIIATFFDQTCKHMLLPRRYMSIDTFDNVQYKRFDAI